MSEVSKQHKENTVRQNILQMKVNKFIFGIEKDIAEKLEKEDRVEELEDDIFEQDKMIEAYAEIYAEEAEDFEMPEMEEDLKEEIVEQKIKEANNSIWDVETSIKVFKKVENKDRLKKAEDNLVELEKRLEILESMT